MGSKKAEAKTKETDVQAGETTNVSKVVDNPALRRVAASEVEENDIKSGILLM